MEIKYLNDKTDSLNNLLNITTNKVLIIAINRAVELSNEIPSSVFMYNHALQKLPSIIENTEAYLDKLTSETAESTVRHTVKKQVNQSVISSDIEEVVYEKQCNLLLVRKMIHQRNLDNIQFAKKLLPKILNNDILKPDLDALNLDAINDALSVLVDLSSIAKNSDTQKKYLAELHSAHNDGYHIKNKLNSDDQSILRQINDYIYALNLWNNAVKNTIQTIYQLPNEF
ncbi:MULTISPECIES: hypothetical protein [Vibrio]|uniref:Uncharacterized protein n=2 Tax=Vibrio TaxID=662 RepID=A0A7X4LN20_9VIBR|nr:MULTISPECIES: hypothetical protein [Vibrio]MBF9003026.1 hypothetical protein [Vibrio nitrifigilis]MZI94531.1 hypothetical protein [Vibrio eleionomae]